MLNNIKFKNINKYIVSVGSVVVFLDVQVVYAREKYKLNCFGLKVFFSYIRFSLEKWSIQVLLGGEGNIDIFYGK